MGLPGALWVLSKSLSNRKRVYDWRNMLRSRTVTSRCPVLYLVRGSKLGNLVSVLKVVTLVGNIEPINIMD